MTVTGADGRLLITFFFSESLVKVISYECASMICLLLDTVFVKDWIEAAFTWTVLHFKSVQFVCKRCIFCSYKLKGKT